MIVAWWLELEVIVEVEHLPIDELIKNHDFAYFQPKLLQSLNIKMNFHNDVGWRYEDLDSFIREDLRVIILDDLFSSSGNVGNLIQVSKMDRFFQRNLTIITCTKVRK